jgi:predicted SnoaL-like aldol condensation-catalyzing enzyme
MMNLTALASIARYRPAMLALLAITASCTTLPTPQSADTARVAHGFLHVLYAQHDIETAYLQFSHPDLIEHNPNIGNGVAAKIEYFRRLRRDNPSAAPPSAWANVLNHLLIDGDMFAVHHHVFADEKDPGRVFVDIWRVSGGRIVEHWDVIQNVPPRRAQQPTMWCDKGSSFAAARALGATSKNPACGAAGPEENSAASRKLIESYIEALAGPDAAGAIARFNAPDMIQHSPHIPQGVQALAQHVTAQPPAANAKPAVTIARILAQGNLVLVHRHRSSAASPRGYVAADLFRVANGRIVEHWDVHQDVPETTANGHTMW